ncbi:gluconate 2-dehydrogenase subunit 3 family protein [Urechidicola croceus]|uniref:Twin-arginine translocation pathway signal protein n=1 Tax=Urechidicola croceus TaxID=1850246 RepID=A0A1D8PAC0_9FLAO|nr:gluconate 2-dehydrogenase subunit 3 family protein [Urechidicola croceus]AOW21538.1 hypothetical protein LPB138_13005 [Urechidicola croceus]
MERRELIKLVTLATGAVLTVPLSSTLLTACKKVEKTEDIAYALQFFNKEDFSIVKNLIDVILPKTDSPSASDVGVHQIIDTIIGKVYTSDQQKSFSDKFSALKTYLLEDNQLESLQNLSKSTNENDKDAKSAFLNLKQQTIAYYLSTEEISKNYLNFLPIPGEYKPCIKLDEVNGKAWAI